MRVLSGELDYRLRYDVEHDLFHPQNVFSDEYITPTFIEYVQNLEKENAELRAFKEKCRFNVSDICKDIETEDQLNKAKKLLRKVVTDFHNMDCVTVHIDKTIAKAEQFISEMEND